MMLQIAFSKDQLDEAIKELSDDGLEIVYPEPTAYPCIVKLVKIRFAEDDKYLVVLNFVTAEEALLFVNTLKLNIEKQGIDGYEYTESDGEVSDQGSGE